MLPNLHKKQTKCINDSLYFQNKVAVADSMLRSGGRNLICFVLDLDKQSVPSMYTLMKSAENSASVRDYFSSYSKFHSDDLKINIFHS